MILKINFFNFIREIKLLLFKAFVAPCLASSSFCLTLYSCYLLLFYFYNFFKDTFHISICILLI